MPMESFSSMVSGSQEQLRDVDFGGWMDYTTLCPANWARRTRCVEKGRDL
jgi:hypothetical protein